MKISFQILILTLLSSALAKAQVGVGTNDPKAALDIRATAKPEESGILIPKLAAFSTGMTADQDGILVYIDGSGATNKGFYYYEEATLTWIPIAGAASTDDQQIDVFNLNGTNLEISLQDDGITTQTLDLSSLQDGQGGTLDEAYDFGGAGSGRVINVSDGAVQISGDSGSVISATSAQLILTETQANDFSRLRFTNSVETDNNWTIAALTDNTASSSIMNFNHNGIGDLLQLWGDGFVEVNGVQEIDGRLGINIDNPTYALELTNNSTPGIGRGRANAWVTYSDRRIKSDFRDISSGTNLIMQLNPQRYFQHNSTFTNNQLILDKKGNQTLGFLAQELYKILPEAVQKPTDENKELWSVNYNKVIPVTVKAIQEQQKTIEQLEKEIEALQIENKRFSNLEKRVEALEKK